MNRGVSSFGLVAAFLLGTVSCGGRGAAEPEVGALPGVMVWAWHGAHDLRFLNPGEAGVAFLAGTVGVTGGSVTLSPGASSVEASGEIVLLPVVRIEIDLTRRAALGDRQLEEATAAVLGFDDDRYPGLQLDFDATLSQRGFYLDLLGEVRNGLGDRFLSVAALPSWCLGDPWLPMDIVDEVVPMLYSMGVDGDLVRRRLAEGGDFRAECRDAVGISSEEPAFVPGLDRRRYLWNVGPWSRAAYEELGGGAVEPEPVRRSG